MQKVNVQLSEYHVEILSRMIQSSLRYAKKPSWIALLEQIQHELFRQFPELEARRQDYSSSIGEQIKKGA